MAEVGVGVPGHDVQVSVPIQVSEVSVEGRLRVRGEAGLRLVVEEPVPIIDQEAVSGIRALHESADVGEEEIQVTVSVHVPEVDALFLRYLARRFVLEVGGEALEGHIVGSGDDELDREPVWWYQVQYTAREPIHAARITNTILFEIFDDQSNVLRVVRFPEETRRAYYFAPGEETIQIEF